MLPEVASRPPQQQEGGENIALDDQSVAGGDVQIAGKMKGNAGEKYPTGGVAKGDVQVGENYNRYAKYGITPAQVTKIAAR